MNQVVELEAGQWWAYQGMVDFRRFKILAVHEQTVKYLDVYPTGMVKILSSRIQWEFDVERGELILTTQPDWKEQDFR